jgi:hypothetical protein
MLDDAVLSLIDIIILLVATVEFGNDSELSIRPVEEVELAVENGTGELDNGEVRLDKAVRRGTEDE